MDSQYCLCCGKKLRQTSQKSSYRLYHMTCKKNMELLYGLK